MPLGAPKPIKTRVIYNPFANKGLCGKTWPVIKDRLEHAIGPVDAIATASPREGIALARDAFARGYRRFVAVGGDGTLNEVVNGLIEDDQALSPDVVIGHIPAGTSNGVSLALGHEGRGLAAESAFAALRSGKTRRIDAFRVESSGSNGCTLVTYGLLHASVGAPATIGLRANAVPLLKRLGPMAYVVMSVATALTYRSQPMHIAIDGNAHEERNLWGLLLCSSATAGEGLLLAPGASIDDGQIDSISIGALTRREALLQVIPKLADGSYCYHPKVARHLLQTADIESTRPVPVAIDGEPAGMTPLRLRVLPRAVRIAVATSPNPQPDALGLAHT